jgi:hypothetical protein
MAKKCYYITYTNCAGVSGSQYVCSESVVYHASGGDCGGGWFESADLGYNKSNASEQLGLANVTSMSNCPGCIPGIDPNAPCDCVNGGCVPKATYGTPGKYPSLADCEAGCAKDSNCNGECVSTDEIAALQQATSNLRSRLCK